MSENRTRAHAVVITAATAVATGRTTEAGVAYRARNSPSWTTDTSRRPSRS